MKRANTQLLQRMLIGIPFGLPIVVVIITQLVAQTPLDTPLAADLANSFLGTIAQVLAGILAIVFSLSVLAVDIASDRYTPLLFSYFRRDWTTWLTFISLLVCTLISVIAVGIQAIPMYHWGFLAMVWFFSVCLFGLPYYFWATLRLLDPKILAERIRDDGIKAIKKPDRQTGLDSITSLGDVAVKAFGRGEIEIAKKCLTMLGHLQFILLTPDATDFIVERRTAESVRFADWYRFGVRSPVLEQCYRLYKIAVEHESEEIAEQISHLLSDVIAIPVCHGAGMEMMQGILLQHYPDFFSVGVEHRSATRFALVYLFRDVIVSKHYAQPYGDEQLSLCVTALVKANKALLDQDDFELWDAELDYFSSISSYDATYDSLRHDLQKLLYSLAAKGPMDAEKLKQWQMTLEPLSTRVTSTNKAVFEQGLSEISQLIPGNEPKLQELETRIKYGLRTLYATARLYEAFFDVCVYALFKGKLRFIQELWRHVNPPDADAHWSNSNLVYFNIGFLTRLMSGYVYFGGEVRGYHGAEAYALRYYLLCLAYSLQQQPESDWHPTVPYFSKASVGRGDSYAVALSHDLNAVHTFLVNLPVDADKVLEQYEAVASMSKDWDAVFNGQASDALAKAKSWLEDKDRRVEWQKTAEVIIRELPLDSARVESYKKAALEYYESYSQVNQLATSETSAGNVGVEIKGVCHIQCPEKREFTAIALSKPQEFGRVGFEAVQQVVTIETACIFKTALENAATEPIKAQRLNFGIVANAARMINEAGYKATVLLATDQQIGLAWREDPTFRSSMEYEGNNRYIKLETSRLRIIEIRDENVVIMDRSAGVWTTVKPLTVEVAECAKNPLAVCITAHEKVDYRIIHPAAIQIIDYRIEPNPTRLQPSSLSRDNLSRIRRFWDWLKTIMGILR